MKAFIFGILIGAMVIIGLIWHYSRRHEHIELMRRDLSQAAQDARTYVQDSLTNLTRQEIVDELEKTGSIVRHKAEDFGNSVAEATADPRKTAVIKARLLADQSLASLDISVTCDRGNVILSGTATSPENIKKAIQIALGVQGVSKVTSTLKVKEPAK